MENRLVKPFLRIGSSQDLPQEVIPYIGVTALTNSLTGNPIHEQACILPASKGIKYVGVPALVQAMQKLVQRGNGKQLKDIPVVQKLPMNEKTRAIVRLFRNGNLQILLNNHCLFDLFERMVKDKHQVDVLPKLNRLIHEAQGMYTISTFQKPGFLHTADGSLYTFHKGKLHAHRLSDNAFEELGNILVPLSLLQTISGEIHADVLAGLCKWYAVERKALTVHMSQDMQPFFFSYVCRRIKTTACR